MDVLNDLPRLSIKKDPEPKHHLEKGLRWAVCLRVPLPPDAGGEATISVGAPREACPSCGRGPR